MHIEDLQKLCKKLPGVTEDIKWQHDLCFCIGNKMFFVAGIDSVPISASFKVSEEDYEFLIAKSGFEPAPYLARYKWIYVDNINRLSKKDFEYYIEKAYRLIRNKLPIKMKKEIEAASIKKRK